MNIIEVKNLTKKFDDFIANDNVSLNVAKGEIKAIVGENGAGKTTLMNMIYGLLKPTSGSICISGEKVNMRSPVDAISKGIGMVHQHFKLVPSLTIYENVILGIEKYKKFFGFSVPVIDKEKEIEAVEKFIKKYKLKLNVKDKIADISIGGKQRIEILKMLYREVDILILDEPTAVLTPQEVDDFILNMKELKKQGKTIIIITHKLQEVMEISDTISVIKRGKIIGNLATKDTSKEEIAQMMVGRDISLNTERKARDTSKNKIIYSMENISTKNIFGKDILHNISINVREGEVLGIAGVEGNGQSELVKIITGLMISTSGKIKLKNKDITNEFPKKLRENKIAVVPEDRFKEGLCKTMSISDNIIAGYHRRSDVSRFSIFLKKSIREKRNRLIEEYDVRVNDMEGSVGQLSGGNAQKIIIAREFSSEPDFIIASQPTRGLDIGSIEFIHKQILKLRDNKKAILLISSELSEIMALSDRIVVLYKGSIIGELKNDNFITSTDIGLLMGGVGDKHKAEIQ